MKLVKHTGGESLSWRDKPKKKKRIHFIPPGIKYAGVDLETINLTPYRGGVIWMLSLTIGKSTKLYHNCNGIWNLPQEVIDLLEDPKWCKVMHNAAFDATYLKVVLGITVRNIWCSQVNEVVIQGIRIPRSKKKKLTAAQEVLYKTHSASLKYVLPRYGFKTPDKELRDQFVNRPRGVPFTPELKDYAKGDTRHLLQLQKAQEFLLTRDGLLEVALLENKVVEKVVEMKTHGIGFDKDIWREVAETNEAEFLRRLKRLPYAVENWNSPKQVKTYFINNGVMLGSFKELDDVYLATRNKELGDFILTRELHKSITSYGLSWLGDYVDFQGRRREGDNFVDDDGRIRCDIDQVINTGRMAMSSPNLLQLPGEGNNDYKRTLVLRLLYGKNPRIAPQHRRAFVPRKGCKFVIGDFSGQEMGIMAAMAREDLLIDTMLRGEDVHALVASLIQPDEWKRATKKDCTFPFKCSCPGHKELRAPAKINNFMLAYGGGPQRLAANTGMSEQAARIYCAAHRRLFQKLTDTLTRNGWDAVNTGYSYSADPYRRRRLCTGNEEWQVINQGKNTPIQSAGANMLKLAMISVPDEFYMPLVIHDEIILEVENRYVPYAQKMLKKVMEDAGAYITGIKGLIPVKPRVGINLMKED